MINNNLKLENSEFDKFDSLLKLIHTKFVFMILIFVFEFTKANAG